MKIGIIGSGNLGGTAARLFAKAARFQRALVLFTPAGSRRTGRLEAGATKLRRGVTARTFRRR